MALEQVNIKQLLEDPLFAKWTALEPKYAGYDYPQRPWQVMLEVNGAWKKREFKTWGKAYAFFLKALDHPAVTDGALRNRIQAYGPPAVRRNGVRERYIPGIPGQHPDHLWCGYCRRPTLMAYFSRHHILGRCVPWEARCTICGHRRDGLPRW